MKAQEMVLNIRYDLPEEIWEKVIPEIYEKTEGWLGFATDNLGFSINLPHWFSFNNNEKYVNASVEPSGLQFTGQMSDVEWERWKKQIKEIASQKLGFKIGEIELGEVD
jgi:hypothetical protein